MFSRALKHATPRAYNKNVQSSGFTKSKTIEIKLSLEQMKPWEEGPNYMGGIITSSTKFNTKKRQNVPK